MALTFIHSHAIHVTSILAFGMDQPGVERSISGPVKTPGVQRVVSYGAWAGAGLLAFATMLDAFVNASAFFTVRRALMASVTLGIAWVVTELRVHFVGVPWRFGNRVLRVRALGPQVRLAFVGAALFAWIPLFTKSFEEVAPAAELASTYRSNFLPLLFDGGDHKQRASQYKTSLTLKNVSQRTLTSLRVDFEKVVAFGPCLAPLDPYAKRDKSNLEALRLSPMRAYLAPGEEFAIDLSGLVEPIERELLFAAYDSAPAKVIYRPPKSPFALDLPTTSRTYSVSFGCLKGGENHAVLTWVRVRYNLDLAETTLAFFGGHVLSTAIDPESGSRVRGGGAHDFLMQLPRAFIKQAGETTETAAPLYTSLDIDVPKTKMGTLLRPHEPPGATNLIPASWFMDEVGMTLGSPPKSSK